MRLQRHLLWAALGAGTIAVVAGLFGLRWLAGAAAAILLLLFILLPWVRADRFDSPSPAERGPEPRDRHHH